EKTIYFRNNETLFEELRPKLKCSIGSKDIFFYARHQTPAEPTPVTPEGSSDTLIHHQSVSSKSPNHHAYTVSPFHQPAFVRERHPVGLTRLGCAALTQLPDLFERRHHQLDLGLRVDQERFSLLIVER